MVGGFAPSILIACLLSASCAPAPTVAPTVTPVQTPEPFAGDVADLLAHADEHIGGEVHVTGTVDWIAEGGPSFVLTPKIGQPGVVVLVMDEPTGDSYNFANPPNSTAEVSGILYELTPENADRANLPMLKGRDFVHVFSGSGMRYLLVGHVLSVQ